MGMSKQQRDYAVKQVNDCLSAVVYGIKKKHPYESYPEELSNNEQVALVRSGKVKIRSKRDTDVTYLHSLSLRKVFDFRSVEHNLKAGHAATTQKAKQAIEKEAAPYRKESSRIIDQIMLGDSAEALKLIEGFIKMCK